MGLVYLCKIDALRKYKNKNINHILCRIAYSCKLINNNEIMYRRLYHEVIIPSFASNNISHMSYTQYSRLRYIKYGKIPKKAACYLYGLYKIMQSLEIDNGLGEVFHNYSYSNFTMKKEKLELEIAKNIFIREERAGRQKDIKDIIIFQNSLSDLDEKIASEKSKNKHYKGTYNNIW